MNMLVPIVWLRADQYCALSGEPYSTIESRIKEGVWAADQEYKRIGPRTLMINIEAVNKWMSKQQHVEAMSFPKGSKSERGAGAHASA